MPKKVYVGAMAFIEREDYILIVKRREDHPNKDGGLWEMPSGRLEANESIEQTIYREVHEETKLMIDIIAPFATWFLPDRKLVGVSFACKYLSGDVVLSSEHTAYKWVKVEETLTFIKKRSMIKDINKYLEWKKNYAPIG